ncbi:histidinol-phosphate phosphatase family protein/1-acyl-sn-glycerol-3-phosphate acyltransferase [Variovorax paradoxus]|nr:histidinol-phosphate phosphatase family protein/1-acyl-sn-glycerol-3-phosphate acyltransferase [Variovorax paradoxus]
MKLVILDRNGTINVHREDFVKSDIEWTPLPGALEAVARLNHAGWHVVVASNQSGLGRGLFDMASLNAMHAKMHKMLAAVGGRVDAVFYCPHSPDEGCECRKPAPGLFRQIGDRYGIDLKDVPTAGDSLRDLQAGAAAGCEPHLLPHRHGCGLPRRRSAAPRIPGEHPGSREPRRLCRFLACARSAGCIAGGCLMAFIRSVLHALWMLVTVVPWGIIMCVSSLWKRGIPLYWMAEQWLSWAIGGARVLLGIRTRVTGMENLPTDQLAGAVLLVKHQSTLETFLMPTLMPHPLAFVFKKELIYVPFFGWAMARLDMIHIDRSQRAQAFNKVVNQGRKLLAQGIWIIMFPEGTRIPRGQKGTYKSGGTRLACETGVPVIPVAVTSAKVWPRKAFIKRPGVVDVSIGPAIPSVGRKPDELMREVEAWIESEMRRLDPEAYRDSLPLPQVPQEVR